MEVVDAGLACGGVAAAVVEARPHAALHGFDDRLVLALEIRVSSPSPEDHVEAMLAAWRQRCPIYLALIKPQSVTLTIAKVA